MSRVSQVSAAMVASPSTPAGSHGRTMATPVAPSWSCPVAWSRTSERRALYWVAVACWPEERGPLLGVMSTSVGRRGRGGRAERRPRVWARSEDLAASPGHPPEGVGRDDLAGAGERRERLAADLV